MSGRQTFAFKPSAPVQAQSSASGASRGAEIVGGRSQGGAVAAGPQTDPGAMAGGLGEYFGQLMQPYVERKQQERFFEGFVAAAEGRALDELNGSSNPITKIFGPSSFAEGAQFYTARKAVSDYSQAQLADMDNLKKLDPAEVPKMLAQRARAAMTGDPHADQMIQRALIEQAGPMVDTIAKKRVEWQQGEAIRTQQGAWASAGDNLQMTMDLQADVTDPADPRRTAVAAARGSFLGLFAKPEGMTDESYKTALKGYLRGAAEKGNFHAVTALRQAGIDAIFDDEERTKMEDMYHRYAQRTLEDAAGRYLPNLIESYEVARAKGQLSPIEASKALAAMNGVMRSRTGVDEDLFDWKEIKGEVRSIAELIVASRRRAEDRQWQIEDREYAANERRREREEEARETGAAVGLAWAHGDVNGAIAAGLEEKHFNRLALAQYRSGDITGLARAFRQGQWVSPAVRNDVQALVSGSIDEQYGKNMERAHGVWRSMLEANPGMTAAYFGEWHQKMRAFDFLSRQIGPQAAFTRAFGDSARYSSESIPAETRKEAREAITAAVSARQPGMVSRLFGAIPFNPSAIAVITGVATDRVALGLKNSDTPASALASEAINAALADGSLQTAGGFAWRAKPGTRPFQSQLGLQADEAGAVFRQVVDARLKARGFPRGLNADAFTIAYADSPKGETGLAIIAHSVDGSPPAQLWVPMTAFREQQARNMKPKKVGGGLDQIRARGFDPNRPDRVPKNWRSYPVIRPELLN